MAAIHAHRRLSASLATGLLHYTTASLSSLADGADVPGWANSGSAGPAYDLTATSPGAATYYAASGGQPAYVRFASVAHLVTSLVLPASFTGNHPRTIGLRFLRETSDSCNVLGYGTADGGGNLFDVMTYGNTTLVPHYYAGQISSPNGLAPGVYRTTTIRLSPLPGSANALYELFEDGVKVLALQVDLTTGSSVLHVGGGVFSGYNNPIPRRLVGVYAVSEALTDAEIVQQEALIS